MTVSKRTRYEVLRRDNHACRYCGAMAPEAKLTIDHVMPVALGGTDKPDNLVTACADCNSGKTSTAPGDAIVADVKAADLALAEAMKRAADEAVTNSNAARHADYVQVFHRMWCEWTNWRDEDMPMPADWRRTIQQFADAGLPEELLAEAIWITMNKPGLPEKALFRYMCGICWRHIRQIQDRAAQIMAESRTVAVDAGEQVNP